MYTAGADEWRGRASDEGSDGMMAGEGNDDGMR